MFSCLQILEAFLWFVLITLLNVTLIILTLSVSRLLNLLLRLVAFLLFLNPQCLASISRWITASSSWKRFCLFVCRALSSIMVICMLTAIRLLLTFVMSLYPSRQNTKDQVYAQNEMLAYQQKESTARVASIMENTNLSKQQQVSEIMRQMLTQAQTAGQYFTNDQIKEMTRKVSAEVDLVHQQTQN